MRTLDFVPFNTAPEWQVFCWVCSGPDTAGISSFPQQLLFCRYIPVQLDDDSGGKVSGVPDIDERR